MTSLLTTLEERKDEFEIHFALAQAWIYASWKEVQFLLVRRH